jgi:WXXGXW repeat (2 copies)
MRIRFITTFLFAVVMLCLSASAFGAVGIVVGFAPPPLPVYEQPVCPGDGYLWTPGYWAWGDDFDDYYWVPGTWVMAPEVGFLWTPGYWGWGGSGFMFYDGYWGPTVGFYGGIDYGFGYFGTGFEGGRWDNGHFFYNRAVLNVNVENIHNVYNTTVNRTTVNHVSYNGGNGGVTARATAEQEAAAQQRHVGPVAAQNQHLQEAHSNQQQRASVNQGRPEIAATARPGDFKSNVVKASEAGGRYTPPANRGENQARENASARPTNNTASSNPPGHVRDLPPAEKPAPPNTGDAKQDKKLQQQQEKQYAQQQKERQKLQQQQEKEDQKVAKQNNEAQKQQVEARHQQQTQQLQQRHVQQNQAMQTRAQAPAQHAAARPPH